ncbi:lipopolysaccharide kinase InaA family protein [Coraliomargarita sp. SDUM461004]|uniref:Lipopolysaccharide kinase InaA family protein n=1 Tax=Thalassobacterium sedimentorum TaxID=3041258 RepID=A0ABU1AMR6_9BACT|nr:lipopolysaccharide kinase InaA family protein [Coraliomargarita sp. SDUM461004]MDQ8195145.1 lipopolysaccharide kinase InaA family protein [Coraliomargarita sp. SDUM461004]
MFETKYQWIDPSVHSLLTTAGLLDLQAVSRRAFDWFEEPNQRRGGWSGVTRIVLNPSAPEAEQKIVFLKIQQNHFYRAPSTCFRKRLSFIREFEALQALRSQAQLAPKLLLFAHWTENGNQGALIITESLEHWQAFDSWLKQLDSTETANAEAIQHALSAIAATTRALHQAGWAHFGFYPKHAFIRADSNGGYQARLIDLEKARRPLFKKQSIIEDVSRFLRHAKRLTQAQKTYYLHEYFQTSTFSPAQRKLISQMKGVATI